MFWRVPCLLSILGSGNTMSRFNEEKLEQAIIELLEAKIMMREEL